MATAPEVLETASGLPATMKAMRVHAFGGVEAIVEEDVALPAPGPGEVLVRVAAAGVGPWDGWIRSGNSVLPQPLPLTLGSDLSGEVAALGEGVTGFAVGEPVYGVTNARFTGAYAEFAIASAAMIARKPAALSHVEAASAPVVAVTAEQALFDHAGLKAGQRVLIHGAAGNVGRYAVQLARRAGLHVVAPASAADAEALLALGADEILDRDHPEQIQVDGVVDLVGGPGQATLFDFLAPGGVLISAVAEPDQALAAERGVRAGFMLVDVRTEALDRLTALFEQGALKPWLGEALPLAEARTAHRMLENAASHRPGKIVLEVR
ncbi:MAG: NADP-dependent oxidoreductase [Novosphingobium sp.]|nr:NADP-dependent oxidoreductase [Novosphingobium sp.]